MAIRLEDINYKTVVDPKGFIEECDAAYHANISLAADMIVKNLPKSPIVLLCGPSGSGKTTTAQKIVEELGRRGISSHDVSLDNYFKTVDLDTAPRTPEGDLDLESPKCLDMDLLNDHFTKLTQGECIFVPKYEFTKQMRILEPFRQLQLNQDEIAIFEGIHAFNEEITAAHPEAFKLYISASSDVTFGDHVVFKSTWVRLVRRTVRDYLFRGSDPSVTLELWDNVLRGEELDMYPYKDRANFMMDTTFPYEIPVMNVQATTLFSSIPKGIQHYEELRQVLPAVQLFGVIDPALLAPDAMIREFIGGGIYKY